MAATSFVGMPIFLEDATGDLTNSDFVDYYGRMAFNIRCTLRSSERMAYAVSDTQASAGRSGLAVPVSTLVFGPNNALSTIQYGQKEHVPMDQYLAKVARNSLSRKFLGSDGQEYTWTFQGNGDCEWNCTNASNYQIAAYDAESKLSRNSGNRSRGKQLYIDEQHQHLAGELVTSLMIMRHIRKHGL